jgi:LPPG:FO 2-phospho-L-lactate transferase
MKVTALAGGIGASKLLLGLSHEMPAKDITIIANTGDDIELFGLRVCPDIDTIVYTLAGVINESTGWGISDDSFEFLKWIARYDGAGWFNIGDRDLATHVYRTSQLRAGKSLGKITDEIRRSLGVESVVLPMTDSYTPTRIETDEGEMHFQEYFVRRRCEPRVRKIRFENLESADPAPGVIDAILQADVIIICPSNPFISIGPILSTPGVREALRKTGAEVVAISPIVGGRALKGPAADMLRDLGYEVSASEVAALYQDFLDLFVVDDADASLKYRIEEVGVRVLVTNTVMTTLEDKRRLARFVMDAMPKKAAVR